MVRVLALVLGLIGCPSTGSEVPDHEAGGGGDEVIVEADAGTSTGGEGSGPICQVHVTSPARVLAGDVAELGVEVRPTFPNPAQAAQPVLVVGLTLPNGQRIEQEFELAGEEVCIYCLPTKDSQGCDHSCRYEPYLGGEVRIGPLYTAGQHRIDLRLQNSDCAVVGDGGVFEVIAR